jgi:hypothetical protein
MILSNEKIVSLITNPERASDIREAIKLQDETKVHVTGEGYLDALKRTMGNTRGVQFGEDRELSKPVTLFLTKKIKDELSRWKNTQGTRKTYNFGDNKDLTVKFKQVLQTVWKNSSIQSCAYWLNDALYTDFNGFLMTELPRKEGDYEIRDGIPSKPTGNPYIIFKAIESVHDFMCNGRKVEYIIFNFGFKQVVKDGKAIDVPLYRIIDDVADYVYVNDGEVRLDTDFEVIPNPLGYVPAIQIGDILNSTLNDHVKTVHIYQTLPLLNDYMTRHAEHVSSEVQHAYPILALKGSKCTYMHDNGSSCSKGKIMVVRNSSEVIIVPELDKQGNTYDPGMVGQYIVPPTTILKHQTDELNGLEESIMYSGTGIAKALAKSSIQTATEIVLNLKPLEDKISSILDNIEAIEVFITDTIGRIMYPKEYKGCEVYYGRRLNVRDENLILKEIEDSKRSGMPVSHIRTLLQELIATRNRNSRSDMERGFMLLDLEPMAVFSLDEVQESDNIDRYTKVYKANFDDYIDRFELENGSIILYRSGKDYQDRISEIRSILDGYNTEQITKLNESKSAEDRNDPGGRAVEGDDV